MFQAISVIINGCFQPNVVFVIGLLEDLVAYVSGLSILGLNIFIHEKYLIQTTQMHK